jgi:hypothetical protein
MEEDYDDDDDDDDDDTHFSQPVADYSKYSHVSSTPYVSKQLGHTEIKREKSTRYRFLKHFKFIFKWSLL